MVISTVWSDSSKDIIKNESPIYLFFRRRKYSVLLHFVIQNIFNNDEKFRCAIENLKQIS